MVDQRRNEHRHERQRRQFHPLQVRQALGADHLQRRVVMLATQMQLHDEVVKSELASVVECIQSRPGRKAGGYLVTLPDGEQAKKWHLRVRFDAACKAAIETYTKKGNVALAERSKAFQFRDIRAKSASEIVDMTTASALLGHTEKDITERVYRRIG